MTNPQEGTRIRASFADFDSNLSIAISIVGTMLHRLRWNREVTALWVKRVRATGKHHPDRLFRSKGVKKKPSLSKRWRRGVLKSPSNYPAHGQQAVLQSAHRRKYEMAPLQLMHTRGATEANPPRALVDTYPCDRIHLACRVGRAMGEIIGDASAAYLTRLTTCMLTMLRGVSVGVDDDDVADVLATSHASWCFLYGNGYDINDLPGRRSRMLLQRPNGYHALSWDRKVELAQENALRVLDVPGTGSSGVAFKTKVHQVHAMVLMVVFSSGQRLPW